MRVRIIRKITRRGDKTYISYVITLPRSLVEALGFDEIREVELEIRSINEKPTILIYKP